MTRLLHRINGLSRDLKLLWIAIFSMMFGFGIYSAAYYNFATEVIKIRPDQLGILEAIREMPGFLCILVTGLAARIAEPLLGSLALMLTAIGMGGYAEVMNVPNLMIWSFIWSVGFHTWMPLQSSLVLHLAGDHDKGKRIGQAFGVASLGSLCGMALVKFIGYSFPYPTWFLIAAGVIAFGALTMLAVRRNIGHADKPRFVWKRRYSLYYRLTFLEGCRRQVFLTFAIYALTREYHTPLQTVALLMVINCIVNIIGGPMVGRLIDRIGERTILLTSYSCLIVVFLGYAIIRHAHALYICYLLDNFFFLSTVCLTTYIQKIAEPEDLMPTLSLGVTLNHTAAVLVPVIGGFLWASMGYPVTFFGGAVVVAISLFTAAGLRVRKRESPSP